MKQRCILTGQMANRRAPDVDAHGVPVMRIVVLRDQPGSDRQAVFPATRFPGSRHLLSPANALKGRLAEMLTDDSLPAIVG
jgi:hypothetical protein